MRPEGGEDQSGKVNAGDPEVFVVSVGGKSVGAKEKETEAAAAPPPPPRDVAAEEKKDGQDSAPPQQPSDAPPAKKGFRDRMFDRAKGKAKGYLSR